MLKKTLLNLSAILALATALLVSGCAGTDTAQTSTSPVTTSFTITTSELAQGNIGTPYSQTLAAANGSGNYVWSISGALPRGLTLDTARGVISGTPTTGSTNFTVNVSDGRDTASKALSITINPALVITTASLPDGTAGRSYYQKIDYTGGGRNITWSTAGSLPPGVYINTSGILNGVAMREGTFNFQVIIDDGIGTASKTFTITINEAAQ
jgi:large repetitive protein